MNAGTTIRIMIVDDHALVRDGLEMAFARQPDLVVAASVDSGMAALNHVGEAAPDVVLLDLRMPGMHGLEVLEAVVASRQRCQVLVLSGQTGDDIIHQAMKRGAAGYLFKTIRSGELVAAIRTVRHGRLRHSPEVAARLADRLLHPASDLSAREIEVLEIAAQGSSNKEIAASLGLTPNTIRNHLSNIMSKLQTTDRTESVNVALRRGIIDLEYGRRAARSD